MSVAALCRYAVLAVSYHCVPLGVLEARKIEVEKLPPKPPKKLKALTQYQEVIEGTNLDIALTRSVHELLMTHML